MFLRAGNCVREIPVGLFLSVRLDARRMSVVEMCAVIENSVFNAPQQFFSPPPHRKHWHRHRTGTAPQGHFVHRHRTVGFVVRIFLF